MVSSKKMSQESEAVDGPKRTSRLFNVVDVVSLALAFVMWGGWAFYVNREGSPWVSGLPQGLGRFVITLIMVRAGLPRGEALFVPFNCDVVIGEPLRLEGDSNQFIKRLGESYRELFTYCLTRHEESSDQ